MGNKEKRTRNKRHKILKISRRLTLETLKYVSKVKNFRLQKISVYNKTNYK